MTSRSHEAIQTARTGRKVFCKFLSANDTGSTGAHQAGIYIPKKSFQILFDQPGVRGQNKDRHVNILWHDGSLTESRFIYYGRETRDEYRITRFGKNFPYFNSEHTGSLFILIQLDEENYKGYVLDTEDDIDLFLDAFSLSPTETNQIIDDTISMPDLSESTVIQSVIDSLPNGFPSTEEMALFARNIWDTVNRSWHMVSKDPDKVLLKWTETEYRLFRALEYSRYHNVIGEGFLRLDDFIDVANQVLNRRKSRAGKSLEHHLSAIFDEHGLLYQSQAITEGKKRPDFLFPSQDAYHDYNYPIERIVLLAAKRTCKDRWRQIINEADRLRDRTKFLCTLQQGISSAQMDEMETEHIILVIPKQYIKTYPKDRQHRIWTLRKFVGYVKEVEGL